MKDRDQGRGHDLASIRRFEAAGFRAWPAASVRYDGTWVVRLTASHPGKRLNSVNPLDPGDDRRLDERIARARRSFDAYGRPLTFRLSPLSAPLLSQHLDGLGWKRIAETLVMSRPLDADFVEDAIHQIPLKDMSRFITAALKVREGDAGLRPGLSEVISSIEPEAGLFVLEHEASPVATAICVHDRDLAGLFELATDVAQRGKGYGRRALLSGAQMGASSRGRPSLAAGRSGERRRDRSLQVARLWRTLPLSLSSACVNRAAPCGGRR